VQGDHQVPPWPHIFLLLQMLPGTQNQEQLQAYHQPYIKRKTEVDQIILMQKLTYNILNVQ
jgi:hypothetical protein